MIQFHDVIQSQIGWFSKWLISGLGFFGFLGSPCERDGYLGALP